MGNVWEKYSGADVLQGALRMQDRKITESDHRELDWILTVCCQCKLYQCDIVGLSLLILALFAVALKHFSLTDCVVIFQ